MAAIPQFQIGRPLGADRQIGRSVTSPLGRLTNTLGKPATSKQTLKPNVPKPPAGVGYTAQPLRPFGSPQAPTAQQSAPTNSVTTQTPAGGGASPQLDSTSLANIAANTFKVNNDVNNLNQQGAYALTDLQNALAQLGRQEPLDQLKMEEAANRRGALFSSVYNNDLGNLTNQYQAKTDALNQNFQRADAARQGQIAALLGGIPLYNNQQGAAAASRLAALAAANPPAPAPTPGGTAPPPAPVATAARAGSKAVGFVDTAKNPDKRVVKPPPVRRTANVIGKPSAWRGLTLPG